MGTYISINIDANHTNELENSFQIFKNVDSSLSTFNPNSIIYRLNRDKKVKLNRYSYEALKLCSNYYKKTNGYFDISIGSITKDAYRFGNSPKIPSAKLLENSKINFS
ncbi:MAG: FAD:protein FMN transferase, partial [Campylobacterota bacterium]|nr:FAD:protein FMN transferase [Campylobacterota bacterium]